MCVVSYVQRKTSCGLWRMCRRLGTTPWGVRMRKTGRIELTHGVQECLFHKTFDDMRETFPINPCAALVSPTAFCDFPCPRPLLRMPNMISSIISRWAGAPPTPNMDGRRVGPGASSSSAKGSTSPNDRDDGRHVLVSQEICTPSLLVPLDFGRCCVLQADTSLLHCT